MDRWRYAPQMTWAVETGGLTLIDTLEGTVHSLDCPEAAIWDLIGREATVDALISKISAILSMDYEAAREIAERRLTEWTEAGFLLERAVHG